MSQADYMNDSEIQTNIERHLEVIGEAVGRVARIDAETVASITEWRSIVDFRNVIAHGYDVLDHRRIFAVIEPKLPQLCREVAELLAHTETPS